MKYIVIIGDGMADRPIRELGGKTPLQVAFTPNMDRLARTGSLGRVRTIPEGFHPGSKPKLGGPLGSKIRSNRVSPLPGNGANHIRITSPH